MNWIANFSTRAKIISGFGLMILLLIVVIGFAYSNLAAIQKSQQGLYETNFVQVMNLLELRTDFNRNRALMVEMILTTDKTKQQAWEKDIQSRSSENDKAIALLAQVSRNDSEFIKQLDEFKNLRVTYTQVRDKQFSLIAEGKIEEARQLDTTEQEQRFEKMRSLLLDLATRSQKQAGDQIASDNQATDRTLFIFLVSGIVALVVGIGMTILLIRAIVNPLNDAVNVLASSASEILAATTQVASGATETATAISETTTTVEEVRQAAQLSTQKARNVSDSSQKTAEVAQRGKRAVDDTVGGITRIQGQMESIAESIIKLSEQSQTIGEIIVSVNDLADQSNLLAVNAAIEAAKAGEHGRGFTVVAQEIKSLAEQSKQATAQVRSILSDIQKATGTAVMATEQGSKAVEAGVKQSAEAGEAIRMLADSISEAAQAAVQIVASSQQQMVGVDQVATAMENIHQASTQNVASTRQVEATAQTLHELGLKLKQLVR